MLTEGQPDSIVREIENMIRSYVEKVMPTVISLFTYSQTELQLSLFTSDLSFQGLFLINWSQPIMLSWYPTFMKLNIVHDVSSNKTFLTSYELFFPLYIL